MSFICFCYLYTLNSHYQIVLKLDYMFRLFRFIRQEEDYIVIKVPKEIRGKLVEILISEKAPDDDTVISPDENSLMETKEAELKVLDKIRNQINFWDM